jgi:cholesterol transport system auxiliary component
MMKAGPLAASRRRFLSLTGASLLVAGCSDLLGQKPPQLYMLPSKHTYDTDLPTVHWQLVVAEPVAPESLDTARIALSHSATKLDYFADSAWTDRAPVMIQGLLIESFENTGKIIAVGRIASDLRADYLLQTELRDFEARYYGGTDEPPKIYVRIEAKLVKMPDREIIGNRNFVQEMAAARNDIGSIIAAFDDALGSAMKHLVEWTLRTPSRPPL